MLPGLTLFHLPCHPPSSSTCQRSEKNFDHEGDVDDDDNGHDNLDDDQEDEDGADDVLHLTASSSETLRLLFTRAVRALAWFA